MSACVYVCFIRNHGGNKEVDYKGERTNEDVKKAKVPFNLNRQEFHIFGSRGLVFCNSSKLQAERTVSNMRKREF